MLYRSKKIIYLAILLLIIVGLFLYLAQAAQAPVTQLDQNSEIVKKSYQPDYVRGIYLTAATVGNDQVRQKLIKQMQGSRINTVVIDIKDYSGYILYESQVPSVREYQAFKKIMDIEQVITDFHQANIYIIARQTVFQDPVLAAARPDLALKTKAGNTWKDKNNLAWLDPKKQGVWEYNVAIAQEAIALGFDEINFDYMRYPSDGNIANISYGLSPEENKSQALEKFYQYLSQKLSSQSPISIDMFGLVMDNFSSQYDLGIGQRLVNALDNFDYICPMMYPSHYAPNYLGFKNPADYPGEVISFGINTTTPVWQNRRATLRPWLQAFSIGAVYDQQKIEAQITATENASTTNGWLLWNARNYYPDFIFSK